MTLELTQVEIAPNGTLKLMQAAVVHGFDLPLSIEEVPIPKPGPRQILIKVAACGVCHTDLHAARGDWPVKPQPPFIPGHEVTGTVVELGEGVLDTQVGDRVGVPWLYSACGHCEFCLTNRETLCLSQKNCGYSANGGYAQYMVADADYAVRLPDNLSFAQAAPILCAGVTTYKALKVADLKPDQWVVIYGVGGLGHMAIQYAVAMGYWVAAVDTSDAKLALAHKVGAAITINASKHDPADVLQEQIGGAQAAIITAASRQAFESGVRALKRGGTAVLVGLPPESFAVDIFSLVLNGQTIRGSIVGTRADLREALAFAAEGKVEATYQPAHLEDINTIFTQMANATIEGRKVLMM